MDFDSPAAAQKAVTALKSSGVQAQMAKVRNDIFFPPQPVELTEIFGALVISLDSGGRLNDQCGLCLSSRQPPTRHPHPPRASFLRLCTLLTSTRCSACSRLFVRVSAVKATLVGPLG